MSDMHDELQRRIQYQSQMMKIVDNYTLTEYLGKGQYGKVFKATNIDTKIDVAVKMISLTKFSEISKLTQLTRNQLEILKLAEHNINVINFVEMIKTNNHIYLVYQFCEGGTLEDVIRAQGHLPEKEALRIFKQLINAFKTLNEFHILHRDVKPNNIFFKSGHLKLADFGFCKRLTNYDDLTQTSLGSPLYMAPEVLNGDVYGSKADVWSVGIVLYQMLFGNSPFGDCNIKQLMNLYSGDKLRIPMSTGEIFISPVTENMLRKMLEKDQFKRISWEDFFYEYDIDEYGAIKKRQKDFEYDLMKLMKKNSSRNSVSTSKLSQPGLKFDWSKITDRNSSVHSQQLNYEHQNEEGKIDEICTLKKKVKEFEIQHEKRVELASLIEEMLGSSGEAPHHYSDIICYFLIYNLQEIIQTSLPEIQEFMAQNKEALKSCPAETNALNKMVVVFRNEAQTLATRLNLLKITLLSTCDEKPKFIKYPDPAVMATEIRRYIADYEKKVPGILNLLPAEDKKQEVPREELIFVSKVLWGISTIKKGSRNKDLNILFVKPDTTVKDLTTLVNRLIVFVCG